MNIGNRKIPVKIPSNTGLVCSFVAFFFQGRGKTTLLAALKGHKLPLNLSTVGIMINEWQAQASSSSRFTLQRFLNQVRQRREV